MNGPLGSSTRVAALVVATVTALAGLAARAAPVDLPADRAAVLLARALAYDANLAKRAGAAVDVAVVYRAATDQADADKLAAAFNALSDLKVGGLPLKAATVAFTSPEALAPAIGGATGFDEVLVVGAFSEHDVAQLRVVCDKAHALMLATTRPLAESGAAIAVSSDQGKANILVNLDASKAAGAELGAGLLRLAIIIKGGK